MNALETLAAARALWDKQNDQLSFEDSAPDRDDGNPHALSLHSAATPGPSTKLVARTDGGSPCSVTFPANGMVEERHATSLTPHQSYGDGRATLGEEAAVAGGDST